MRIVIIGASGTAMATAHRLLDNGHEIVIIEADEARIDEASEALECGFLHGDGSRPSILREASPDNTDVLLCLSDSDQNNIIAALVGRALGFERVVLKIADPDYQTICDELELDDLFLPDQEIGRALVNLIETRKKVGLTAEVHGDLRFFSLLVGKEQEGALSDLDLPEGVRPIAVTRNESSLMIEDDMTLRAKDVVLLLTLEKNMETLYERFDSAESGGVGLSGGQV